MENTQQKLGDVPIESPMNRVENSKKMPRLMKPKALQAMAAMEESTVSNPRSPG